VYRLCRFGTPITGVLFNQTRSGAVRLDEPGREHGDILSRRIRRFRSASLPGGGSRAESGTECTGAGGDADNQLDHCAL
jgi:hypothetical protein